MRWLLLCAPAKPGAAQVDRDGLALLEAVVPFLFRGALLLLRLLLLVLLRPPGTAAAAAAASWRPAQGALGGLQGDGEVEGLGAVLEADAERGLAALAVLHAQGEEAAAVERGLDGRGRVVVGRGGEQRAAARLVEHDVDSDLATASVVPVVAGIVAVAVVAGAGERGLDDAGAAGEDVALRGGRSARRPEPLSIGSAGVAFCCFRESSLSSQGRHITSPLAGTTVQQAPGSMSELVSSGVVVRLTCQYSYKKGRKGKLDYPYEYISRIISSI